MPKRSKNPSMAKVASTYKKAHKTTKPEWSGARLHDNLGGTRGTATTTSKLTYKPKAKSITLGTTVNGRGGTKYKKGRA